MSEDTVLLTVEDTVATVTLNHPATRNALSLELMRALISTFRELGGRPDVHAIVLAAQVAQASSATVAIGKRAFYEQIHLPTAEAYARMNTVMADNAVMPDAREGIDAFLTKREPQWQHRQ